MKVYWVFAVIICLISCRQTNTNNKNTFSKNSNTKTWLIQLDSNLGQLKIELPKRFDTTFKWVEYSDCSGCEHIDYRVQNKSLPVFKESGFVYYPLEDSVEQFTMRRSIQIYKSYGIENDFEQIPKTMGNSLKYIYGKERIILDTQLVINRRYFNVEAASFYNSIRKTKIHELTAYFLLKNNPIKIIFEYRKSYPDSNEKLFISEALEAIESIKIL